MHWHTIVELTEHRRLIVLKTLYYWGSHSCLFSTSLWNGRTSRLKLRRALGCACSCGTFCKEMSNIINLVNAVWENCWHWLEGPPEATWLCFCWGNIYLNVLDNTIIFSLKDDLGVDWLFESQTANIRYFANHVVRKSSWCWRCNCWAWWIQFWWTPPKSKLSSALISYIPTPVLINLSI